MLHHIWSMSVLCSSLFKKQQELLWQQRYAQIKPQSSCISREQNAFTLLIWSVFTLCMFNAVESLNSLCVWLCWEVEGCSEFPDRAQQSSPKLPQPPPPPPTDPFAYEWIRHESYLQRTFSPFCFLEVVKIAQLICESSRHAWLSVFFLTGMV